MVQIFTLNPLAMILLLSSVAIAAWLNNIPLASSAQAASIVLTG